MSPATKSKPKDKKASKESLKASTKLPGASNTGSGSGIPASAYNPLLGTFHTLDPVPTYSAPSTQPNSRFRNIEETDDQSGNSLGAGADYDSVSNNDSWSGESEDHKEKPATPAVKQDLIPGADNDKREKIRQKNERKHRRQKERRAQELHERCTGYLMSRKLEALAQQLVAMGFSLERATMALILNEGKVEESVTWLFEGHEGADKCNDPNLGNGTNLKLDISDELAQIADMEIRYKCSTQEVERAIVTCEGDLDKAAEALREQRQDLPSAPDENDGSPNVSYGTRLSVAANQNMVKLPQKSSGSSTSTQQKRDEKDFNYTNTKTAVSVGSPSDLGSKHAQPLRKIQSKLESLGLQQQSVMPPEKRWIGGGSNIPVSYPLTSPLHVSPLPAKLETHYGSVGGELKNLQPDTVREPVIMVQRQKPINAEQTAATSMSSSPPGTAASRRPNSNGVSIMKPSGLLQHNPSARSLNSNDLTSNSVYWQNLQQHQQFVPGCSPVDFPGANKVNSSCCRIGSSSTLAAAASLGLFSGLGSSGSSGSSSPVDWNNGGSTTNLDYSSIDWSLDLNLSSSRPSGLWLGLSPGMNAQLYESDVPGLSSRQGMRFTSSNMNGVSLAGMQDGGSAHGGTTATPTSHEWACPFEGNDLFNLPRQFVSPPL